MFSSHCKNIVHLNAITLWINYTDSQKRAEVIERDWRQNFMLALGNLIITPQKIKILWFNFCGRGQNVYFAFKTI